MSNLYDANFYARNLKFQAALAKYLAPWIAENLNPRSVCDFGCGCGKLLAGIGRACGCDIIGINKDMPENLQIPKAFFKQLNFTRGPVVLSDWVKFDLVISLEVAEHIPVGFADTFVFNLKTYSEKYIIFSAATPGQGGVGHVNEQPHEYWHKQFIKHGFKMRDIIRPMLKGHKEVPFWYRRNCFLYERKK